jgi:acyl carrier protein
MTLDREEILGQLGEVFEDVFDETIALRESTTAQDVDGWDSLTHVRLMMSVEKRFRVRFSTFEISNLANLGELVSLIQAKVRDAGTKAP